MNKQVSKISERRKNEKYPISKKAFEKEQHPQKNRIHNPIRFRPIRV